MENPHCNSVAYVNGIPILLTLTRPGKNKKARRCKPIAKGKTTNITFGAEE